MLILTRKRNQTIRLNDLVTITIVRIGHGQVRIGIEAPKEVVILRGELERKEKAA